MTHLLTHLGDVSVLYCRRHCRAKTAFESIASVRPARDHTVSRVSFPSNLLAAHLGILNFSNSPVLQSRVIHPCVLIQ